MEPVHLLEQSLELHGIEVDADPAHHHCLQLAGRIGHGIAPLTSSIARQKIRDSFKRFNQQTEQHLRIGVFNDGLAHLSREDAFAWCAAEGLEAIDRNLR